MAEVMVLLEHVADYRHEVQRATVSLQSLYLGLCAIITSLMWVRVR